MGRRGLPGRPARPVPGRDLRRANRRGRAGSAPVMTPPTLFDRADAQAIRVPTSCGRNGTCHECVVEVSRGAEALAPPTEAESFLRGGYRLACQARVLDPRREIAFAPLKRRLQIVAEGRRRPVALEPPVRRVGDAVWRDGRPIDAYRGGIYGLAVDIGTTTVALSLVDLESGAVRHTSAFENPQRFGGADVLHRISYDGGPFRAELHQAIVRAIDAEIRELCRQFRVARRLIYEVVAVGNPTMRDLFFGLDVQSIGQRPFRSTTELALRRGERCTTAIEASPRPLGLHVNSAATAYGAPLIGSHVGADAVAGLLAIGMDELADDDGPIMLVDVGTNTEVVVGDAHRIVAASCPAGPAFEGGGVRFGMPGCAGAIESVHWRGGRFEWRAIGGARPEGICGSGLIDLLAEMRRSDRMDRRGVFANGAAEVALVPEHGITFSRSDVSQLAQAKAANYAGQLIALRALGIPPEGLRRVYLAGGFANRVDVANAIAIGFLPDLPHDRIVKVGNAALEGAVMMLLSTQKRAAAERLARRIEHLELEEEPDFFDVFVEGCLFQSTRSAARREEVSWSLASSLAR
ncbi:MAG: DUF4445 domain-containing protein [Chloroflexota bacterium]|nr:MAG: DUF4445 domain-containing protein [Chloroflexota bacterium]